MMNTQSLISGFPLQQLIEDELAIFGSSPNLYSTVYSFYMVSGFDVRLDRIK